MKGIGSKNTVSAFILNMDCNGLGVARSVGREGILVVGVDHRSDAVGLRSRFCRPIVVPHPSDEPDRLLGALVDAARTLGHKPILFPTSDAFVLFISRYRAQLAEFFLFAIPPEKVVEALVNKRLQYEEAVRLDVPIAKTFYPRSLAEVEQISGQLEYPAFIKPYYSHLWQQHFGNKGFLVKNAAELNSRFVDVLDLGLDAMVQSVILGPNTNHFKVCTYVGSDGEVMALFTTQKIRQYPTDFGVGTLMKSVRNPEVAELGLKFFRGIGYRGIGSIEFKRDERDGRYKMIELNPRLWQQNIQATYAGINFPLIQYLDLTGTLDSTQTTFKEGVRWFDAIQDFQAFWSYRKRGQIAIAEWFRSWWGSDCYAYFAWDDPIPAWRNSRYGLKYLNLPLYLLRNLLKGDSGKQR